MELAQKHHKFDPDIARQYTLLNSGTRDILKCIERIAYSLTDAEIVAIVLFGEKGPIIKNVNNDALEEYTRILHLAKEIIATGQQVFPTSNPVSEKYGLIGGPLVAPKGEIIGTLCLQGVFEKNESLLKQILDDIARLVMGELELLHEAQSRMMMETELAQQTIELKMAKVTLEQQADQLQNMVIELEEAKKEVESSSKSKETFFASMSHEIRTPMNGVMGMTTLLLDTPLSEEQRGYVEVIRNSGESLLVIINDILDFSKIEAGHLDLEQHPFKLITAVEDAFDLLAVKAAEKKIGLGFKYSEEVPLSVVGDSTRLRQILVNLLSNAIKFTDEGQVIVRLEIHHVEQGLRLDFAVEDSGIGITDEQKSRLFKSFSQASSSTTRKYGGTGLGLAISKSICNLMGGEIWVESTPGVGSTFYFNVIVSLPDETADTIDQTPYLGKTILISEQHPQIRSILVDRCEHWGMEVVEAESTQHVIELVHQNLELDILLLDLGMDTLDPKVIMDEVNAVRGQDDFGVVAMNPVDTRLGENRKLFDFVLTKPVRREALQTALSRTLGDEAHENVDDVTRVEMMDVSMADRLPLRILLVEDNVVNQKVALRLLEKLGYRADLASNGLEAVEAADSIIYDLILMDVQMPEMNGLDATRQILARANPGREPIIIAMTAASDEKGQMECLNAGMKGFLTKPFQFDDLIQTLEIMQLRDL